jgi:AraC family transcriptional regulator of adaptative response/methylated-DNA-[protein]-cysteine methyltransferase
MLHAFLERDVSFDGIFYTGVTTTGIFCRPACTARRPKREHIIFFPRAGDALAAGYRPCKLCRPMEPRGTPPGWIRQILEEVERDGLYRLSDGELRSRGLDPEALRRWFKRNHDMTFQTYLRLLRLGAAVGRIQHGDSVTEAAFEHGYDSLSGFNEAVQKAFGGSGNQLHGTTLITVSRIPTPLGPMLAGATEKGLCLLEFVDRRMLETQLTSLQRRLQGRIVPGAHPLFDKLAEELKGYFAGTLKEFTLPLDTRGTDFQMLAWSALRTIPYGSTRSYKEQAEAIGMPSAVRAVARANSDNRIAILIPCHRVIGADGSLTGYGGGLWRKRYLLNLELESSL